MCGLESLESSLSRGSGSVLLAEFVHATRGVEDLLLARVERMAVCADFDLEVVSQSRARLERIPAGAGDVDFFVVGMRIGFHGFSLSRRSLPAGHKKKGAQSSGPFVGSQALIPRSFYPQNLWITLWVGTNPGVEITANCAKPLGWSNNDHCIKDL